MDKCIMVKLWGNENHVKYVKKYVNFYENRGNILKSSRGNWELISFAKRGEWIQTGEIQHL